MTKSPFIVYILPIILSVSLGTIVMAEALNDSERELNMWQFDGNTASTEQELSLIGLEKSYSVSELIEFNIKVNDDSFNCGDLYITIYKTNPVNQVVTQSGYLKQCLTINQQNLPIDENYSVVITESGTYRTVIELSDEKHTLSHTETFIVR
jgi:hypothetical protein|tara:strand:+ start:635 stop:1090 length:456 start_codon:yes stop_codon:yes gene_type:complete